MVTSLILLGVAARRWRAVGRGQSFFTLPSSASGGPVNTRFSAR